MAKKKGSQSKVHQPMLKKKNVVDTENEFAAEFGESLYGSQARVAFNQERGTQSKKTSK